MTAENEQLNSKLHSMIKVSTDTAPEKQKPHIKEAGVPQFRNGIETTYQSIPIKQADFMMNQLGQGGEEFASNNTTINNHQAALSQT